MKPSLLYLALLISYFGDYCSLIGLFELGKLFGGNNHLVALYVAYSLPPVLFLAISKYWANHQKRPARQLSAACLVGAVAVATLPLASNYLHLLFASFVLGIVKHAARVLVNAYIKRNYTPNLAEVVVGRTVAIRYFIMVFGGALGAYLGGRGMFNAVYAIDGASFVFAAVVFFFCKEKGMAAADIPAATPTEQILPAVRRMIQLFGWVPFLWLLSAFAQNSLFMSIEYPLLTTELGVATHLIGIVWFGHVLGTLIAERACHRVVPARASYRRAIVFVAGAQIVAFGTFGFWGNAIWITALQMAVGVFFMVSTEILASTWMMRVSNQTQYPIHNILLNTVEMFLQLAASFVPIMVSQSLSLQNTNLFSALAIVFFCVAASVASRWRSL